MKGAIRVKLFRSWSIFLSRNLNSKDDEIADGEMTYLKEWHTESCCILALELCLPMYLVKGIN